MKNAHAGKTPPDRSGRLIVGVQLDPDALRLVAIRHGYIRAWSSLPYPPGVTPASPDFPPFLKRALNDFSPKGHNSHIWVLGAFPSLQLRFFNVPRTRSGRLANMVYWTFRKEIPFDAALRVFDYDVEGEQTQYASRCMNVTAYTVSKTDVDALSNLFEKAGCRLQGIVIPHFAMRNLFQAGWLNHDPTALGLYVGEEFSSVQIQSGGQVALSRVFITGLNAILDALRDRHPDWSPAQAFNRLYEAEEADTAELWDVSSSALGRLMQQIDRTIAAYLAGRGTDEIKRIHVMGALSALPRLVEAMGAQSGIHTEPTNLFKAPHLTAGISPPENPREAALLTLAAGVALSDPKKTPNLLNTYAQRDREARAHKSFTLGTAVAAAVLALLLAGYGATTRRNQWKTRELMLLRERADQYPEGLNRELIARLLGEAQASHTRLQGLSQKCRPIALVSSIAALTPEDIRLSAIRISPATGPERIPGNDGSGERVVLEGRVTGLPETQESRLASYVMGIEAAGILAGVSVVRTVIGSDGTKPLLEFEMAMWAHPAQPSNASTRRSLKERP